MDKIEKLSSAELGSTDSAEMTVIINGRLSTWVWTFGGPGHPQTVAYNEARARERLHQERMKEQAITNGRKWKAPEETVDEVRLKNVNSVVERMLGWSQIELDGAMFEFSPDNARKFLIQPKYQAIYMQALEFLGDEASFTHRSPAT